MSEPYETKGRAEHIDQLVSRRLKTRRMILGLSQNDLGKAGNVSIQQVHKYEKSTNRISSGKLFVFAEYLKVPISYFYEENEASSTAIGTALVEDKMSYDGGDNKALVEKEIVNLIKAFSEISNFQSRKKIIELVKTMVLSDLTLVFGTHIIKQPSN